nr:S9 family peptidase [candidate division Zixibacteria bacterium]NIR68152.1 S9 family peptidase [candidate division Zixibacteria bacterium]NIS17828.1 S9 family peptidase [candidate division Zixibacteria bacterium]NIS49367.1 S9 family peptidase [candidate division Zixibacteria bacterium]NIT54146.1 S9 family peptidase [candidate division Zixibacteria bacterium]
QGYLPKDRFHIWKVTVESGKDEQLTKGRYDEVFPAVSPDGKQIAFVSNRSKDPDLDMMYDDLFVMSIKGGKQTKVSTPSGPIVSPSFSPDGKRIAYLGHTNPKDAWGVTNFHVWTVGVNGKPAAKDLIPKFDRSTMDTTIGDLGEAFGMPAPIWSKDGKRLYFITSDEGNTHIFYAPMRGGLPTRVTHKKYHIKEFSMNGKKSIVAAVVSDLKNPTTLNIFPPSFKGDKKIEQLEDPNKDLFKQIKLPGIRTVWFKGHDGFDLQGWLVTPPDRKKKKYPAILEIHGGPRAQYGFTFYHEMLYLASKGYIVFYTNPRGGSGRGETFAGSIVADWGSIDYEDCMAAADYLENLKDVNPKKMGVTGGSYGGYMTNWIVGHTNRFKAAVTQRSVVNLNSFIGSSDMGYDLFAEFDGYPWTNPEVYEQCSPITYAKKIKTPLLIIHSEQDLRCGLEQGQNLFATLKLMKKRVEMVIFPEEPHGLSRHGRPDRRLARLDWISKWFNRYLK